MLGVGVSEDQLEVVLALGLVLRLRWDDWIEHYFKHVVDHFGHEVFHEGVRCPEERIIVDLNEPNAKVLIKQKIEAEKFEDVHAVIWIHFALDAKEGVNDEVLDPRQQELLDPEPVLAVMLVEVALQVVIVQRVALLVLRVALAFHLEALVSQVHEVVLVVEVVLGGTGPQIAVLVEVNAKVVGDNGPDPNVELAPIEEKGVLDVLLHDPAPDLRVPMVDAIVDVAQIPEYLNASPLVQRRRLHQPHVLLAVLHGHALLPSCTPRDLLVSVHQQMHFVVVLHPRDNESGRSRVEHSVAGANGRLNRQIILLERKDQASLGSDPTSVLKVVQEERLRCIC